ncbi:MAG TPA: tannase/feruloyl esterase family alpha/beta hydrolase [Acidimicrobiia bacterium]|nr:tannase/feruloyl esterase family alpha/beta hydrolase [Acidimicrobiia bacterium]
MKRQAIRIGRSPNGGSARNGVTAHLRATVVVATALALLSGLFVTVSPTPPAAAAVGDCESLESLVLDEVTAISAELDNDGLFTLPPGPFGPGGDVPVPTFCRVQLTVSPAINIEVWLPTNTYNNRFQAVGGGVYAGVISYDALVGALNAGYATASTDTGHQASPLSGAWAFNPDGTLNDGLVEDFASRSLFELTKKAKALIEEFYGAEEEYAYWNGCSTGGRQGLMLAQRMPEAYDGILAGAPAINWDRFHPGQLWFQVVMQQELGAPICQDKLAFATQAAVEACDRRDGVEDGVIADPSQCKFDARKLIGEVVPDSECGEFTKDDAVVVNAIWDGARAVRGHSPNHGKFLWYGLSRGAPLNALAGTFAFPVTLEHLKWVQEDQAFDWTTLDYKGFTGAFRQSQERFNDVIGTDDPDLRDFRNGGGKVLLWHGWYDQLIMPEGTIDYYERVVHRMGGWHRTADFARLFMAPGVFHCGGGPGPNQFNAFGALVAWVEGGDAPNRIIASGVNPMDGQAVTRPLCLYPRVARYDGKGDPNQESSFDCRFNFGGWWKHSGN